MPLPTAGRSGLHNEGDDDVQPADGPWHSAVHDAVHGTDPFPSPTPGSSRMESVLIIRVRSELTGSNVTNRWILSRPRILSFVR